MARKRDAVWDTVYAPVGLGLKQNTANDFRNAVYNMYIRHLTELSVNRFKWTGLPKSIDPRFLELQLFRRALAVFYWDNEYARHLALAAAPNGGLNMYDNPISFTTYGNHMKSKTVPANTCIPIWANMLRMPDLDIVQVYARRLADMDITIEIAAKNLRRTKIIAADENSRLSYQNIERQIDEGVPVLYVTKGALEDQPITALDLGGDPVGLLNLQISKSKLWSECMTMLGINNANQDKKERLVADEVSANDEQVFATRGIALNSRKLACELINEKFTMPDGTPLNISVEYNEDSIATPTEPNSITAMPGLTEMGAGN